MVKCAFLGHPAVFEPDLSDKLDAAIGKILRKNGEAEFLFYQRGTFYRLCLVAVLKAQRRYPQKQIRITFVRKYGDDLDDPPVPMCLIDTILEAPQFPPPKREHDFTLNHRRTVRWTIGQCSYLISYMYPQIQDDETQFYRFAKQKKRTILDVTSPDTAAYLEEQLNRRSEREQAVIKSRQAGRTWGEIGAEAGVSAARVETNAHAASRALIRSAVVHLRKQPKAAVRCGIFTLGEATPEKTDMFRKVVSFLITRCQVTEFKITAESSYSGYMNILRYEISYYPEVRISIVTHDTEDAPEQFLREKRSRHKAFCDSVENVNPYTKRTPRAQMLQTVRWMMGNTDYCICNLPDNPLGKSIENHARKLGGVRLIDIGKTPYKNVQGTE